MKDFSETEQSLKIKQSEMKLTRLETRLGLVEKDRKQLEEDMRVKDKNIVVSNYIISKVVLNISCFLFT